jgi:hypothetical protein
MARKVVGSVDGIDDSEGVAYPIIKNRGTGAQRGTGRHH